MSDFLDLLHEAKDRVGGERVGEGFNRDGLLLNLEPSPLIVVGDLHGDLKALEIIMKEGRLKERLEEGWKCIFLGDYGDRGPDPLGVYRHLFELKVSYPDRVFLLKGNHEGTEVVRFQPHDLPRHINTSFPGTGDEVYRALVEFHSLLPVAVLINSWLLLIHGGVTQDISRSTLRNPTKEELTLMLWSDPYEQKDRVAASPRGAGVRFGPEVTGEALGRLGVSYLIRSHSAVPGGYRFNHHGRVLTVFSAKHVYSLERGAFLSLEPGQDLQSSICLF